MRIGLSAYDITTADLVQLARAADELGFASLWLGEHIVLPLDYGSEHPTTGDAAHQHHKGPIIDPNTILVDPLVALAAVASATTRLQLATGIYLLPLRHPLISARMTATLHDASQGRFSLGVGSGWLEEEFAAVGVPFADRKLRFEESLEILRLAWAGEPFEYRGTQFSFGRVQMSPAPIGVPLVLGGNTEPALRRAAKLADGWFASGTPTIDDAARLRDRLGALREENGHHGEFPVCVRTARADADFVDAYAAQGLDHVLVWADQVWPRTGDVDTKRAALATWADRLGVASVPGEDPPR